MPKSEPKPKSAAKPLTKAEIHATVAEKTGLSRKEIGRVFDALADLIHAEMGRHGKGIFVLPGLLKLRTVRKAATKAKQGTNPFTKEPMTIAAKPARNVVRATILKALKEV